MTSQFLGPRKQRTRQHVIADLSVHHIERFILAEGHTAQRLSSDYGYDLVLFTYDQQGYLEPGSVFIQLKATESLRASGADYVYDLDIRDYNLWTREESPIILVLFDAARKQAFWLPIQTYFRKSGVRQPKKGAKTVRVRVPIHQVFNRRAVATIRDLKWDALR
jgi:hypothetical protein